MKVDVLAVMTPPEHRIADSSKWRYISSEKRVNEESSKALKVSARGSVPTAIEWETISRYETPFAVLCVEPSTPRPIACIDLEELEQARAAIAELIEAHKELMAGYESRCGDWENADFNACYRRAAAALDGVRP